MSFVPYKGRHTLKPYIKNEAHKWGFKIFTRAGVSGLIYDFQVYVGEKTCPGYGPGMSGNIVMSLCEGLENKNHKIFCDNCFSSLSLAVALRERGIFMVGTIRAHRMRKCPRLEEKDLKKKGR